jgi:hypothetical protein
MRDEPGRPDFGPSTEELERLEERLRLELDEISKRVRAEFLTEAKRPKKK